MGCGKSKHDVVTGNTVSQSKRLSSESKKIDEPAEAIPKEVKDTVPETTEVKGGEETKIVTEEKVGVVKAVVEEKKSEGISEPKEPSVPEVPAKEAEVKAEPENVVEEKKPVEEAKTEKDTVEGQPQVAKEETPVKAEAVAKEETPVKAEAEAATSPVEEAKPAIATEKVENQTTEKVVEADAAPAAPSNPKNE